MAMKWAFSAENGLNSKNYWSQRQNLFFPIFPEYETAAQNLNLSKIILKK
jgi:hypothetical protein